ncbi:MAG: SulP family inorganic anion transporter [Flavobacteriales bacterium]|nr:SulP family inorganic anion transporter [Flavobacteriales bacterium]
MKQFFSNIKYDLPAGLVVFLVAVPLCLGIALASGAPLFSGVIAGMVGGTVVALISGSPLGVSGPAAGLAVIVLSAIQELGGFDVFLLAVVVAGFIQLILGIIQAGVIGYYFPTSVIKGMLSAIGVIIVLKQIPHAFGYDRDYEGDMDFVQPDGQTTFSELTNMLQYLNTGAIIIAALSLGILILWEQKFIKRLAVSTVVQGPLVVVVLGIILNIAFQDSVIALGPGHSVNIPVAGTIRGFFDQFTFPDFSAWNNKEVYFIGITIAIVASLETLLCVEATDKLDPQKRITPTNRELIAQGTGNILAGLIGGIPVTQVIVRSSANIQSGGRTKAAAFIHGILIILTAMFIPTVLNLIPLASLAAILIVVGYKLANPGQISAMYKKGMNQFLPFAVTLVGIVFSDLLIGIALGMAVAIMGILWNNYKVPYHFHADDHKTGEPIHIHMSEDVSFLNKAGILHTLNELPNGSHVIIDASRTKTIHPDVLELFDDFRFNAPTRNIQFEYIPPKLEDQPNPMEKFGSVVLNKKRTDR